jgi:glutamine amidotransferase
MQILVVDSGVGNVGSILSMLKRIGHRGCLIDAPCKVKPEERLILPGVGAFDAGMAALVNRGFDSWLRDVVAQGTPLLGICLGMQLLFDRSEEGSRPGLGLLSGDVVRLPAGQMGLRSPHMGWNTVRSTRDNPILPFEARDQRFYFVHSFFVKCDDSADSLAVTDYGVTFSSAVGRGNIFGVQFHPEKSHRFGMALLDRFATSKLIIDPGWKHA